MHSVGIVLKYINSNTLQGFRTFGHILNYSVEHMNQIISPTKFYLNERMKSEGNSNENAFKNEQLY